MKKIALKLVTLLSIASSSLLFATTDLRTPLSIVWDFGPFHYPLQPIENDSCWRGDIFNFLYERWADDVFAPSRNALGTRKTVPITQAIFGATSFVVEQAFAGSETVVVGNPFVSFSTITPGDYTYWERGLVSGGHIEYNWCDCWRFGLRAVLPFKLIELYRNVSCLPLEAGLSEVDDCVIQLEVDNIPGSSRQVCMYRIDFLNSLLMPNTTTPVVKYSDPNFAGRMSIAGVDITTATPGPGLAAAQVYAIRSVDGTLGSILPQLTDISGGARVALNVAPAAAVNADGSGGANGDRLDFLAGTNYTPLGANPAQQRQLFIIPNSTGTGNLTAGAAAIQATVNSIVNSLILANNVTAINFLLNNGVNICDRQRVNGFGDLDVNVWAGWDFCECSYAELYLGVRFPTGRKQKDARLVLFQPTGNYGHYEFRVQLDLGWQPWNWLGLHVNAAYNHVFRRVQQKAAAFTGATIFNIGPSLPANVSWNYFVGHADATFFHPCNENLGIAFSYELYVKGHDKVSFLSSTAVDFNGVVNTLNPVLLENNTKGVSNKLRGEMFHRWNYCELSIGASRCFAGKNLFKETEAHIGIGIFF